MVVVAIGKSARVTWTRHESKVDLGLWGGGWSEDRVNRATRCKHVANSKLHLHVAMNFHAYHTDEMATPAATTEVQAIRQRQQDHLVKLSLREVDSTSVMLYPQLGLTPRKSTKKTANSHTTTQLSNSHEKRVKT